MILTLLSQLPVPILEMIMGALLIVIIGIAAIVFAVLISESACRRIIRLLHAVSGLTNRNMRSPKRRRHSDNN